MNEDNGTDVRAVTPEEAERNLIGDALWTLVRSIGWDHIPYEELAELPCPNADVQRFVEATIVRIRYAARILIDQADPGWPPPLPPEMFGEDIPEAEERRHRGLE